jgi:hypothetical protein
MMKPGYFPYRLHPFNLPTVNQIIQMCMCRWQPCSTGGLAISRAFA